LLEFFSMARGGKEGRINRFPWERRLDDMELRLMYAIDHRGASGSHKEYIAKQDEMAAALRSGDPAKIGWYRLRLRERAERLPREAGGAFFRDPDNFSRVFERAFKTWLDSDVLPERVDEDPMTEGGTLSRESMRLHIQHEREHWERARRKGFRDPFVGVLFFERDGVFFQPLAFPGKDDPAWSDEEFVKRRLNVTGAPRRLSPGDRRALGK
jgi:hypothetical protein